MQVTNGGGNANTIKPLSFSQMLEVILEPDVLTSRRPCEQVCLSFAGRFTCLVNTGPQLSFPECTVQPKGEGMGSREKCGTKQSSDLLQHETCSTFFMLIAHLRKTVVQCVTKRSTGISRTFWEWMHWSFFFLFSFSFPLAMSMPTIVAFSLVSNNMH